MEVQAADQMRDKDTPLVDKMDLYRHKRRCMGTTEGTVNGEEEVAVVVAEAMAVDMRGAVVVGVVSVAEGAGETVEVDTVMVVATDAVVVAAGVGVDTTDEPVHTLCVAYIGTAV